MSGDPTSLGAGDFDFIAGSWSVRHRRLMHRLVGCEDWVEFDGTMHSHRILAGFGNFDTNVLELPAGRYEACTIRTFDADRGEWTIRWIDGRDPRLDPPVLGSFAFGVGTFFGEDVWEGRSVRVRYRWSDMTDSSARWDQAFSGDSGETWEVNWIMEFRRR